MSNEDRSNCQSGEAKVAGTLIFPENCFDLARLSPESVKFCVSVIRALELDSAITFYVYNVCRVALSALFTIECLKHFLSSLFKAGS